MTMHNIKAEVERIKGFIAGRMVLSGAKGVVVGISGGIDSALVAKLCAMVLDKGRVHALFMPYGAQPVEDSYRVAKHLCIRPHTSAHTIQIGSEVDAIARRTRALDKISLGNIQARMRMVCLYAYANSNNLLVVGTSNRSEMLTGYFTKYGDGGCDFEPIAHLYKTEVWKMAKYLKLPAEIISKKPSAGLWAGQTDEDELGMPYDKLDRILEFIGLSADHYFRNPGTAALSTKTSEEEVERVAALMMKAGHKLKMPPTLPRIDL